MLDRAKRSRSWASPQKVLAPVDAFRGIQDRVMEASERIVLVPYGFGFEDMQRRVPDTPKIPRAIGWVPALSLDQTLEDFIQSRAAKAGAD